MDILKTLLEHRSIRKFRDQAIPEIILERILEAGIRASTTGNMQLYSIIITKEKKNRELLAPLHFNQSFVIEAPILLTFCADLNRFNLWCLKHETTPAYDNFLWFINAATDALLVAQNVAIAAEALGLGICYLGTTIYNADKLIDFFQLPKHVVPITTLAIGYPDENPDITDRLPLEAVIHMEKYKDYTADDINRIYHEKENMPFYKKIVSDNNVDNLAQVFTEKRYIAKDNLHFSQKFLETIIRQQFMNNQ